MSNPFDRFDKEAGAAGAANPFDQFEVGADSNPIPMRDELEPEAEVRWTDFSRYSADNFRRGLDVLKQRGAAAFKKNAKEATTTPVRVLPSLAVSPLGPLATSPMASGSEAVAQFIEEGRIHDKGALAKAGALGAIPGGSLAAGVRGVVKPLLLGAAEGGAKFAIADAVGESARRTINSGDLTGFADREDAIQELAGPVALGTAFGAVGTAVRKVAGARAAAAERREVLGGGGIEQPTLDLVFPSQAALVNRVAQRNPNVAKLRVDATRPLVEQFEELAAGAPQHEEIYAQLRPFVGRLDSARNEVAKLEQHAVALRGRAAELSNSAVPSAAERAAVEAEVTAAELNAINAKARMLHEANANLGGFLDYDSTAQQFRGVVDQLFATRKQIGATKFAAANVPADAPIFDKQELIGAARKGLSRFRGSDMEKQIIGAIDEAGGEVGTLSLNQFRELRQTFTDRFAGMDPRQLSIYEAASRQAYGALTEASKRAIGALPGANLAAYEAALGYWRQTAEAQASRYARPLLAREASESTFQSLASDIAAGRKAEVRAFNDFVAAVAEDAPDVARLASQQLTTALRNSFLGNARTATGVDTKKLTDSLLRAADQIDVGALGFGAPKEIRRWHATFQEYGLKNVAEADLNEIFANPQVQQAALNGKSIADALRPAAARKAFENNVRTQMLTALAGNKSTARAAAEKASKLADAAELSVMERRKVLAEIEADPVMQAFASGQSFGIPMRPGGWTNVDGTNGVTNTILNLGPKEGPKLIAALAAKRPALAELVERRIVADTMQFFRPANTPGHVWALDKSKTQRFFSPAPGSAEETYPETIRAIVGNTKFTAMQKIVRAVQMVADVEKSGGVMSTDGAKTIFTSSGLARGIGMGTAGSSAPTLLAAALRSAQNLVDGGKYHTLSLLASNKKFATAFWRGGGDVGAALTAMGTQRTALLLQDAALRREVEEQEHTAP